jgi:hypothetical protein
MPTQIKTNALKKVWVGLAFLFFFFIFFLYSLLRHQNSPSISEKISQIPLSDRLMIEAFFRILLFDDLGAYVLFGDKPLCWSGYYQSLDKDDIIRFFESNHSVRHSCFLKSGWKIWQKYAHLFPSKKFILNECIELTKKLHWTNIYLIDKEKVCSMIFSHREDFEKVLGEKNFDPNQFLRTYLKSNQPLHLLLKEHEGLFGTLLGYGRNNSWLFHARSRTFYNPYRFTLCINPKPSPEFGSLSEERDFYDKCMNSFCVGNNAVQLLAIPYFLADLDSQETKNLYKNYIAQKKLIHSIYKNGNFLEITLKQFTSDF